MKIDVISRLKLDPDTNDLFRRIARQLNDIAEGRIQANYNATTAAPSSGTWRQGDEIKNSAPTELGSIGSKYVINGWKCVASGTPGTWVQMRFLTGN
jgi:hypothetical protein